MRPIFCVLRKSRASLSSDKRGRILPAAIGVSCGRGANADAEGGLAYSL